MSDGSDGEETMKSLTIRAVPVGMAFAMLAIPDGRRCQVTQQHVTDLGDIPGHQIRVFELDRVYPNIKPNCEGLKWTESWTRGLSDYVDRSDWSWGYEEVYTLERGDKIFKEHSGTVRYPCPDRAGSLNVLVMILASG
jgi:hypothetical protein